MSSPAGAGTLLSFILVSLFALVFAWLAIQRHETYRTNAEDLGFTDQMVWNFLRGQVFRFSIYEQAAFTADIDLAALKRPDSMLAFHVEPMAALLAPLYVVRPDIRLLLALQALGWALGGLPTYRLARRRLGSGLAGLAFALVYLLAPLGQWAVLSDFHTVTLAAPLLLWAADLLESGRSLSFLLVGLLAASAKEEVGLALVGLGLLALRRPAVRRAGLAAVVLGIGWSALCVTVIIPRYAGTAVSPFTARYAELGGSPEQALLNLLQAPSLYLAALGRPEVVEYAAVLLLSGGWLALLAPEFLLPALPSLMLNVLSSSTWMASGRAHYSAVVLPFVVLAAIVGAGRLGGWLGARASWPDPTPGPSPARGGGQTPLPAPGRGRGWGPALPVLALFTTALAYHQAGAGPLADGFVWPQRTAHDDLADWLVASIPPGARVAASSSLAPHLTHRPEVYLFPTVRQADYVALDVSATPAPSSAGDVYLRTVGLLVSGDWRILQADDGLLLLQRGPGSTQPLPDGFFRFARSEQPIAGPPLASYLDGALELVSGELRSSGEVGPDGPLGTLTTVWRATRSLSGHPRPRLRIQLDRGSLEVSDFASLWWYPPEGWRPGELIELKAAGLPLRRIADWQGMVPEEPS